MAKPSGKSTKNSGNTKKVDSGTVKKSSSNKVKTSANKKFATKQNEFVCEFCQKPMNSQKTLKIHERNCKIKSNQDEEKNFEKALMKIKDESDDERQALEKQFMRREDALQKEMDEMRTVLRMEIDRHRKELEMIRKVEKEVHNVTEKQNTPQAINIDTNYRVDSSEISNEEDLPEIITKKASPEGAPKAIDMIPTPLPVIPKKVIVPEIENVPENTPKSVPETKIEEKSPEPVIIPGMSKEEIEELVKSLIQNSDIKPATGQDKFSQLDELNSKLRNISSRLDSLDTKIDRFNNDYKRELNKLEKESNVKRIEKEMDKISEKVIEMMEDIGFSEDLSVSKIPPTILEIVYQATLDDIHREIIKAKGPQDAETIAMAALEEVRLKTSGSELFKYDGRKIITDNLAKSIEANHISAKQIQTTYDVLLEKLLETIPHHKAKNFKGMIKVKSQEFAVDRATVLTKDYARIEKIIESSSQMIAAISAQSNAKNLELSEAVNDIKENLLARKADNEEIEYLKSKILDRDETDAKLADEIAFLKAEIEMKEQIKSKEEDEGIAIIVPGETIDVEEIIEKNKEIAEEKITEKPDISPQILEAINKGANSKTAIIRDTGLEEDDILLAVSNLIKEKKVIEKKVGKRIIYVTPELEMEEKIRADGKKDTGKKKTIEKPKKDKTSKKKPVEIEEKTTKPEKEKPVEQKKVKEKKKVSEKKSSKKKEDKIIPPKSEEITALPEEKEKKKVPEKKSSKKKEDEIILSESEEIAVLPEEKGIVDEKPAPEKEVKKKQKINKSEIPSQIEAELPDVIIATDSVKDRGSPKTEEHVDDELQVITRKIEDLTEDELLVLEVISHEGMTVSGIQSKAKGMKRFALLRALRVLIDSGYVGIITKGRMELYQKINVKKMDKNNKEITNKEVN